MVGWTCATCAAEVGAGELLSLALELFLLSQETLKRLLFERGMILFMTDRERLENGNLNQFVCCFNCPRGFCLSCLEMTKVLVCAQIQLN